MFERFTADARAAVVDAQTEARGLNHNYIGTEHLLLGLLVTGRGPAAAVLTEAGMSAASVRAGIVRIVGRGDEDVANAAEDLRVLGINLDEVRSNVEATFGPGALELPSRRRRRRWFRRRRNQCGSISPGHIPFTPRAKKVLELALREALMLGHHYIGTEHIALGLLREGDGLAAFILAERWGLDDLRRQLLARIGKVA